MAAESMGVIGWQGTELQLVNYGENSKHTHVTVKVGELKNSCFQPLSRFSCALHRSASGALDAFVVVV